MGSSYPNVYVLDPSQRPSDNAATELQAHGVNVRLYRSAGELLHAKVAVIDDHWATVGSSNIDPYSLLMAREANVFVRDRGFSEELKRQLDEMISNTPDCYQDWLTVADFLFIRSHTWFVPTSQNSLRALCLRQRTEL